MVDLVDAPLDSLDGRSIRETYENRVASLGQQISLQQNETTGLKDFYATLQSQHLAITGVNIDEESIRASGLASDMPPSEIAVILAEMKAASVSQHFTANQATSEHYILGCDQILFCNNRIYLRCCS